MAYKQHFIEWFSGKQIPSYWTRYDDTSYASGTGTDGMVDAVDEGAFVKTGNTQYNISNLAFNGKRQYNPTGSRITGVVRRVTANSSTNFGLYNLLNDGSNQSVNIDNDTRNTYMRAVSGRTTPTATSITVPVNTVFKLLDIVLGASNIKFSVNGILEITQTVNRPTEKLQPRIYTLALTNANAETRLRYLEAYNT